jgi:hypothetical protein
MVRPAPLSSFTGFIRQTLTFHPFLREIDIQPEIQETHFKQSPLLVVERPCLQYLVITYCW